VIGKPSLDPRGHELIYVSVLERR